MFCQCRLCLREKNTMVEWLVIVILSKQGISYCIKKKKEKKASKGKVGQFSWSLMLGIVTDIIMTPTVTERYHGAFSFCSFSHIYDLFLHGQKRMGSRSSITFFLSQISTIKLFNYLVKWIWLSNICVLKWTISTVNASVYIQNCTAELPKLRLFILFTADKIESYLHLFT